MKLDPIQVKAILSLLSTVYSDQVTVSTTYYYIGSVNGFHPTVKGMQKFANSLGEMGIAMGSIGNILKLKGDQDVN